MFLKKRCAVIEANFNPRNQLVFDSKKFSTIRNIDNNKLNENFYNNYLSNNDLE